MAKKYLSEQEEIKLNFVDRLGLAYCRLNSWEWDDIVGPKPEGFDKLPNHIKRNNGHKSKGESKGDHILPYIERIEAIIG